MAVDFTRPPRASHTRREERYREEKEGKGTKSSAKIKNGLKEREVGGSLRKEGRDGGKKRGMEEGKREEGRQERGEVGEKQGEGR